MAFFDELSRTISSTTRKAGKIAGDSSEIARLKLQTVSEEDKLKKAYIELGKKYYELHSSDAEEALHESVASVAASLQNISEAKKQIEALRASITTAEDPAVSMDSVYVCPKCGTANDQNNKFCVGCGAAIILQEKVPEVKICTVCGQPLEENMRFCTNCGTPVIPISAEIPTEEETIPAAEGNETPAEH